MRIAFIGAAGHYGYVLDALSAAGSGAFEVCGVAPGLPGEDLSALVGALERQGVTARVYDEYTAMLDDARPDLAVINSHFGLNARIARRCLESGAHVYMDKPAATTLEDAEALERAYRASGRALFAMFGIREESWYRALKQAVDAGRVGDIRLLHTQKSYKLGTRPAFYGERLRYGGTFPWVASHAVDWAHNLCRAAFTGVYASHSIVGNGGNGGMEATTAALFTLEGGVTLTVSADYLRPASARTHGDDAMRVAGTRGVLIARGGRVLLDADGTGGETELPLPEAGQPFLTFVSALGTSEAEVMARDALYVTRACLLARQSADEGRAVSFDGVRW